jgi:hypothetical protein
MEKPSKVGKLLRVIGIILMGITAGFYLLGGIGTTCVALGAEKYDSMAGIVPYKWLYQLFVITTVIVAIFAIRATVQLVRGKPNGYRNALIILVVGLVLNTIHMYASQTLRGDSAPVNVIVYFNIFTLVIFLIFRIPGIWEKTGFDKPGDKIETGSGAGIAMILAGVLFLTVHLWAGPTHTWGGINYADAWHTQLTVVGWGLILSGGIITLSSTLGGTFFTSHITNRLSKTGQPSQ